jgi:hypothetical protein
MGATVCKPNVPRFGTGDSFVDVIVGAVLVAIF